MIKLQQITFQYQEKPVFTDLSLEIPAGKYTCIVGANGSGKSTLAKLLVGLLPLTQGSITVDGIELTSQNYRDLRQYISIVFQDPDHQFVSTAVEDEIAFSLENLQSPPHQMREEVEQYLQLINLTSQRLHSSEQLSGGQKQKVAIAAVLALQTPYLLLDEATSMLDQISKQEMVAFFKHLQQETGKNIISITHDMEELLVADHIIVLGDGGVLFSGGLSELFEYRNILSQQGLTLPFLWQVLDSFHLPYTNSWEKVLQTL